MVAWASRVARFRRGYTQCIVGVALVFAHVYSFPYFPALHSANELPRIYLTLAMVDRGSLSIDAELRRFKPAIDVARFKGRTYANKSPGVSLLAVPAYVIQRWVTRAALAREPTLAELFWGLRFGASVVPTLLFLWLLSRYLMQVVPQRPLRQLLLLGYGLGTMSIVYGTLLLSHGVAAALLGASWFAARRLGDRGAGRWVAAWSGFAAGAAVQMEYPAAFVGPFLFGYVLWISRRRLRDGIGFACASAVPLAGLLIYHWVCFDSPFKTPMHYHADAQMLQWSNTGFLGFTRLDVSRLAVQIFSARSGLLYYSPMLILSVPGLWLMLRRPASRRDGILCLAVSAFALFFIGSLRYAHGGWTVGPRYIAYALPFLFAPVAVALAASAKRWYVLAPCAGLIVVSVAIYLTAASVFPHYPHAFSNPLFDVTFRFAGAGYLPYNLGWLVGLRGAVSLLPLAAVVCLAFWPQLARVSRVGRLLPVALALAVAVGVFAVYRWQLCQRPRPVPQPTVRWMAEIWQPKHAGLDPGRLARRVGPCCGRCAQE